MNEEEVAKEHPSLDIYPTIMPRSVQLIDTKEEISSSGAYLRDIHDTQIDKQKIKEVIHNIRISICTSGGIQACDSILRNLGLTNELFGIKIVESKEKDARYCQICGKKCTIEVKNNRIIAVRCEDHKGLHADGSYDYVCNGSYCRCKQ